MRILRAAYNKAVALGYSRQQEPFKQVYTGVDKTQKRAVDESIIQRLCLLDLSSKQHLAFTRDIFMFSYFTRGMAFVDIAYLRHTDIGYNALNYIRRKTGQRLIIHIEPEIRTIIERYDNSVSPYVFPIITSTDTEKAYSQYQSALSKYNKNLKCLSLLLGPNVHLSSYTSRHTWASSAQKHQIPLSVISAGMGHTSESTTRIYLASLDNSIIDQANLSIISKINYPISSKETGKASPLPLPKRGDKLA